MKPHDSFAAHDPYTYSAHCIFPETPSESPAAVVRVPDVWPRWKDIIALTVKPIWFHSRQY